jgi:hypothetical protein
MVRNTKGGKGAKSMARKSVASGSSSGFPVPSSDMEHIAVVEHMFGPTCNVVLGDGSRILCHIRNKFKGRQKSRNLIRVGSILLIGYREWEKDTDRKNSDLLFVYDDLQASSLADRFFIPTIEPKSSHHDISFDNSDVITSDLSDNFPSHNAITTDTSYFDDI